MLMLTYMTAGGHCVPTLGQLARGMQASETKARTRLQRLARFHWEGQPLVREIPRTGGVYVYTISHNVLSTPIESATTPHDTVADYDPQPDNDVRLVASGPVVPATAGEKHRLTVGDCVLALSRARYARPRAEVERQLATEMGWNYPFRSRREQMDEARAQANAATDASADAGEQPTNAALERRARLTALGVPGRKADELLAAYSAEKVDRQLEWLPLRQAKNPARLIVAAIENDYRAPSVARTRATAVLGRATPVASTEREARDA